MTPPLVSIIVPCYNEQATIRLLLDSLYAQTYPRAQLEVILADGLSTDNTRTEISSFQQGHPDLRVHLVDNPKRIIPAGLNCAIQAAAGEIIVRMDAHSIPYPDYVERCVAALQAGQGDNVGGVWEILPAGEDWLAQAIAAAAAHPLGVGDARYRLGGQAQAVDTVPFGAFRCSLFQHIGCFDETLLTNEDYEFNTRVRQSGGVVWFDPDIRSRYFARRTISDLARQYWRYGYWKARMIRRYPKTIRWRQLLPPLFMLSLLLLGLAVLLGPAMGLRLASLFSHAARLVLVVELSLYSFILLSAGVQMALKKNELSFVIGIPLAVAAMHFSWGSAFLWSLLKLLVLNR
jgi:glycosyltransferase involved in cell wall biosynthesis